MRIANERAMHQNIAQFLLALRRALEDAKKAIGCTARAYCGATSRLRVVQHSGAAGGPTAEGMRASEPAPLDRVVAGCLPSVHVENLSRHESRRVQVHHGLDDIVGFSHPLHRM